MIATDAALKDLCRRLRSGPSFAIDVEFQRERTYYPRVQLIQVAGPADEEDDIALIDPLQVKNLRPLFELVADPAIETILHAGGQDMEIAWQLSGLAPRNVFDTQIGAALVGYGDQPGYANLVERILSVRLGKLETVTDWSRRPLTPGQVEYAMDDVRHLHALRQRIGKRLADMGREDWAREEMAHYEERATYEKDLSRLYLRMGRTRSLSRRGLAILRELAAWREEEAMRRDEPRGRVIADEVLVEVARRAPSRLAELQVMRGMHPGELRRSGDALLALVERARALPESDLPEPSLPRSEDPEVALTVDLLEVFLRSRAREADIGPSYLGSRQDLAELVDSVRGRRRERENPPALLTGWRRTLVGDDLVAIASGRVNLHVDPDTGHVTTSSR